MNLRYLFVDNFSMCVYHFLRSKSFLHFINEVRFIRHWTARAREDTGADRIHCERTNKTARSLENWTDPAKLRRHPRHRMISSGLIYHHYYILNIGRGHDSQ